MCFISKSEPNNVKVENKDECWINVTQEELDQFEKNKAWELVPWPDSANIIDTKWIYKKSQMRMEMSQ